MGWMVWTVAALCAVLVAWLIFKLFTKYLRAPDRQKNFTRAPRAPNDLSANHLSVNQQHAHTRRKPDWVVAEVLRLKALMGHSGCRKVAATFNRLHAQPHHGPPATVGKSFVAHCIHTHQYALQCVRADMRNKRKRSTNPRLAPAN